MTMDWRMRLSVLFVVAAVAAVVVTRSTLHLRRAAEELSCRLFCSACPPCGTAGLLCPWDSATGVGKPAQSSPPFPPADFTINEENQVGLGLNLRWSHDGPSHHVFSFTNLSTAVATARSISPSAEGISTAFIFICRLAFHLVSAGCLAGARKLQTAQARIDGTTISYAHGCVFSCLVRSAAQTPFDSVNGRDATRRRGITAAARGAVIVDCSTILLIDWSVGHWDSRSSVKSAQHPCLPRVGTWQSGGGGPRRRWSGALDALLP